MRKQLASTLTLVLLCGAALVVGPASPARAAGPQTISLISGNGAVGTRDPLVAFSLDGGASYQDAYIISNGRFYNSIPGTKYVSFARDELPWSTGASTVPFRASFVLPANFRAPSLRMSVHADNQAAVYLNGAFVGQQPLVIDTTNFTDPPESISTSDGSLFRAGANVLEIRLYNAGGPAGLDFAATVTFSSAPSPEPDAFSTNEDATLDIAAPGLLANDTDGDGDVLTASVASQPASGAVTVNADGSFTYTPQPNFNGSDSFAYTATDPSGFTATATAVVTVVPINDVPQAADDVARVAQYDSVTIGVLDNDTDVDGDELAVESVTQPLHGSVAVNPDNTLRYSADVTFKETDTFSYVLSDGAGGIATATVAISEIGCGEDGSQTLADTPADGAASEIIDRQVEPAVGGLSPDAAEALHHLNCDAVVAAENAVDGETP